MEATYCIGSDMDVCRMFDQYLYKRSENLDLSLSVSHGLPPSAYGSMSEQTFHTPSFGDEDFDIPPINPSHSAVPSSISYHQPPMSIPMSHASTDTMTMTTMSDHHTSPYQQPLYLSPTHDHMPLSLSGSYGGGYPGLGQHSSLHLLQSYSMGPPQSTVRSPQGPPTSHQTTSPQAPHPHETTTTSDDSDDSTPHTQMMAGMKRPSPEPTDNGLAKMQKKPKAQKKKKKRDPNEPQKPVSAYALFFRDTQAAIKGQNPNASFGEVSKIVASMWDTLDADHKNVYKKKTEAAKKDYLKALAAYRASLVSKGASEPEPIYTGYGGYGGGYSGYSPPTGLPSPPMSAPSPQHHLKKPIHMPESRQSQQSQQVMMGHLGQQQQHIQQQQQQPPPQQVNQNSNYMQQQQQQQTGGGGASGEQPMSGDGPPPPHPLATNQNQCIRNGCPNTAVANSEWEDEYCSNECVVTHCRDVFSSWVASNQNAAVK